MYQKFQQFFIKNKLNDSNYLIEAKGTILNTPFYKTTLIQVAFFNNIPDETGIIRSVPLIISYNDAIFSFIGFRNYQNYY